MQLIQQAVTNAKKMLKMQAGSIRNLQLRTQTTSEPDNDFYCILNLRPNDNKQQTLK